MARPERFELPTTWFEARYSIQLSYGRVDNKYKGQPGALGYRYYQAKLPNLPNYWLDPRAPAIYRGRS